MPGVKRAWANWRTKDKDHLDCRFLVRKGQINLTRLEGLGHAEIGGEREDVDVLRLRLTDLDADAAGKLRAVLREQVGGFREVYARA